MSGPSDLQHLPVNGIEIAYETFGDPADPPVVLIMGLGTQMLAWPDDLCRDLADRGLHVVRFDNRDIGASTHLDDEPTPRLADLALRRKPPPYTIADMADDTAGLITGLGLKDAHLVGASMGGFISQTVALRHPGRVRSLTLIMTSTGSRRVGQAKPKVIATLLRRPKGPVDREGAIAITLSTFGVIGSPGYALDPEHLGDLAGRSFDRSSDGRGYLRQMGAITAQPDRTADLSRIGVPTLVMHGLHDPLVAPSGGIALAKAIPGARFVGYSGMGHDLPRALWPAYADEIARHVASASG